MATVPQVIRLGRRGILTAALLLAVSSGCVTISFNNTAPDPTKVNGPIKLVVRWENEVRFAPDTTRGGTLTPGILGRVWLFGQREDVPVEGDGALHIEIADATQSPPKTLETWDLDPETVRKHLRKDAIGMGYSLFLPWATFRPDRTCVELKISFQQKNGGKLFATPQRIMFEHANMPMPEPTAKRPPVPEMAPKHPPVPAIQPASMPRR